MFVEKEVGLMVEVFVKFMCGLHLSLRLDKE